MSNYYMYLTPSLIPRIIKARQKPRAPRQIKDKRKWEFFELAEVQKSIDSPHEMVYRWMPVCFAEWDYVEKLQYVGKLKIPLTGAVDDVHGEPVPVSGPESSYARVTYMSDGSYRIKIG